MTDYYFIYKDSVGTWKDCINPVFIAKHQYCRAIPKEVLELNGYSFIGDFVMVLNDLEESIYDIEDIINKYELY